MLSAIISKIVAIIIDMAAQNSLLFKIVIF